MSLERLVCRVTIDYKDGLIPQTEGVPWYDLRKILPGCQQMANVPNYIETLPKISIAWVGCMNVSDDRQTTDRRAMTYSERERDFTFAKN